MKTVFNLFLVQRLTAWLFQGRHLIGRLEWRHVILNLAANSFHCRSRTSSYMTNKLSITVLDESRDFHENKRSGQSSCRRAKRSWLSEVYRCKRLRLDEICVMWSSLNHYINNQKPIVEDNCPFRQSTQTREL